MSVLICGSNGYLGNALMHCLKHEVLGIDNNSREKNVRDVNSESLTDIKKHPNTKYCDMLDYDSLKMTISKFQPDTIIHFAEQPSAPFSMIDAQHASDTQHNNICGTLNLLWAVKEVDPNIHIIKLGTAGEYPDWLYDGIEVPESHRIIVGFQGKRWEIPTPRYGASLYHLSKLHDSYNIDYTCRIWGLNVTDLNQGVVYGHRKGTRFDYDEYFGTVVNRFAVQAIAGVPLTIYGTGGQTRGFIHINNVMEALDLVIKERPKGYKIIHQLTETKSIKEIAQMIQDLTDCDIQQIKNPRAERPENKFNFEARELKKYGLKPIKMENALGEIIRTVKKNEHKINKNVIMPKTKW